MYIHHAQVIFARFSVFVSLLTMSLGSKVMKVTQQELKQIIKEELEDELTTQITPETGEWDERDELQTFFDLLENAVYMSEQWRTVEEAQDAIKDLGKKADGIRKAGEWTLTRGGDDIFQELGSAPGLAEEVCRVEVGD